MTSSARPPLGSPSRTRLAGLVLAALVVAACGTGGDAPPQATTPSPDARTETGVEPDDTGTTATGAPGDAQILDVQARTIDGDDVDLASYIGRDVAIWFWAPW